MPRVKIYRCLHCDAKALLAPQPDGTHQGWLNLDGSYMWGSAEHNFHFYRYGTINKQGGDKNEKV